MDITGWAKRHAVVLFFAALFAALGICNMPSFGDPPRSDHLSILYHFHQIDGRPGAWLQVLNYDPWTQARYYPFAILSTYIAFLILGSNAVLLHTVNLAVYCCLLVLLYRMAMFVRPGRVAACVFVAVYAFLYSHSDLITWSLHTYIIAGFCLCLCGFFSYMRYMRTGNAVWIAASCVSFIAGLFCYETFVFWPAAVIILSGIGRLYEGRVSSRAAKVLSCLSVLAPVYALYAAGWFLTRALGSYPASLVDVSDIFAVPSLVKSAAGSLFTLAHNAFFVNSFPFAAYPARFDDQVFEMAGLFVRYAEYPDRALIAGAAVGALAATVILRRIAAGRRRGMALVCLFILYLLVSEHTVLFATRTLTNPWLFVVSQFRYQFIPSAIAGLLLLCILPLPCCVSKAAKVTAVSILVFIIVSNAYCGIRSSLHVHRELAPLRQLIGRISSLAARGTLSEKNRVYMDDEVVRHLPALCWNERMGNAFMERTYQWVFDRRQIRVFAWSKSDAMYIVDPRSRNIIKNPEYENNSY